MNGGRFLGLLALSGLFWTPGQAQGRPWRPRPFKGHSCNVGQCATHGCSPNPGVHCDCWFDAIGVTDSAQKAQVQEIELRTYLSIQEREQAIAQVLTRDQLVRAKKIRGRRAPCGCRY